MADPLTIIGAAGAICNIIDVVSKTISTLSDLRARWNDADLFFLSLASQLTALRAALSKIQEWVSNDLEDAHHQLVMDLDVTISCCKLLVSKIDTLFADFGQTTGSALDLPGKIKVVFGSQGIEDVQKLVERQTGALNLLLTACNCKSISEQKKMLEKPKNRKALARAKQDSVSLFVHRDSASFISRWTDNLSKLSTVFDFDSQLFSSDIYQQVFRGSVKEALRRRQSASQRPRRAAQHHILLLGNDERNKRIFMNMLDRVQSQGCSLTELAECRECLMKSCLSFAQARALRICRHVANSSTLVGDYAEILEHRTLSLDSKILLGPHVTKVLGGVLHSPLFQGWEFQESSLHDEIISTTYYQDLFARLTQAEYVPCVADVLRVRAGNKVASTARFTTSTKKLTVLNIPGVVHELPSADSKLNSNSTMIIVVDLLRFLETRYMGELGQHMHGIQSANSDKFASVVFLFTNFTTARECAEFKQRLFERMFPDELGQKSIPIDLDDPIQVIAKLRQKIYEAFFLNVDEDLISITILDEDILEDTVSHILATSQAQHEELPIPKPEPGSKKTPSHQTSPPEILETR